MAKKYVGAWQTLNIIDRMLKKENKEYGITAVSFALERVKSYIQKLPAADVQEVKHGKWVKPTKKFPYWDWKCNVCGCEEYRQQDSHGKYCQMNFCPHCGAKMDGKDGE